MRLSRLDCPSDKTNTNVTQSLEKSQNKQISQSYDPHQQRIYPHEKILLEKGSSGENDSCISISFDSGFSSGDISSRLTIDSSNESRTIHSSSEVEYNKSEDLISVFDSGLGADSQTPYTSEVDIQCFPEEKKTETSPEDKTPVYDWHYVYVQDEDGDTLLHLTIVDSTTDVIFPLIQLAPHPDFLDIFNNLFQTPLHLAALSRKASVVRRLVIAGATLDLQDHHGNTALHIASQQGDVDCVLALISPLSRSEHEEAACTYETYVKNIDLSKDVLNAKNYEGHTSLHLTTLGGYRNVIECLVYHGADVNAQDGKNGKTALHYAVERLNVELVHFLLALCFANVAVTNFAYQTPLHLAWVLQNKNPRSSRLNTIIELLKQYSNSVIKPLDSSTDTSSSSSEEDISGQ